jgi:hypothetical protein
MEERGRRRDERKGEKRKRRRNYFEVSISKEESWLEMVKKGSQYVYRTKARVCRPNRTLDGPKVITGVCSFVWLVLGSSVLAVVRVKAKAGYRLRIITARHVRLRSM